MVNEIKDIGKVKYIGRSGKKRYDVMSEVERENWRDEFKEWRFRKEWKI